MQLLFARPARSGRIRATLASANAMKDPAAWGNAMKDLAIRTRPRALLQRAAAMTAGSCAHVRAL
jgi:hypothetical protein